MANGTKKTIITATIFVCSLATIVKTNELILFFLVMIFKDGISVKDYIPCIITFCNVPVKLNGTLYCSSSTGVFESFPTSNPSS